MASKMEGERAYQGAKHYSFKFKFWFLGQIRTAFLLHSKHVINTNKRIPLTLLSLQILIRIYKRSSVRKLEKYMGMECSFKRYNYQQTLPIFRVIIILGIGFTFGVILFFFGSILYSWDQFHHQPGYLHFRVVSFFLVYFIFSKFNINTINSIDIVWHFYPVYLPPTCINSSFCLIQDHAI